MAQEANTREKKQKTWEDNINAWEKAGYNYFCQEAKVSDSQFIPPSDVDFFDMSKMIKGFQKWEGKRQIPPKTAALI